MTKHAKACAGALAAAMLASLAACDGSTKRQPGPAELALVTQQLDLQLNEPAQRLHSSLVAADSDKRIYPEELVLSADGGPVPVDWWIYQKGWIRLAGVDSYSRGYFGLTPEGEAFAKTESPRWLESSFQGQPKLTCAGNGGWLSCKVAATASVHATKEGATLFDAVSVAPVSFEADLQYGPSGWSASDLQATDKSDPAATARTAMFGDRDSAYKAHYKWGEAMNRRVR